MQSTKNIQDDQGKNEKSRRKVATEIKRQSQRHGGQCIC
jgi:hypothetical protein